MALAPMCLRESRYFDFYRKRVEAGDRVILDNGAYEGEEIGWEGYRSLIHELRPFEYVLPDKIRDVNESWRMQAEFGRIVVARALYVLHDPLGNVPSGIQGICLPKWMGQGRVEVAKKFQAHTRHALGFIDDDPEAELPKLASLGVRSVDSSEPVWSGLGCPPAKFRKEWNIRGLRAVQQVNVNLARVFDLCGSKDTTMRVTLEDEKTQLLAIQLMKGKVGARRDERRPRYDLIPKFFLDELAAIFEEGLKYGPDNWKKGGDEFIADLLNHAQDHLSRYNEGDRTERQLGKVAWNVLARAWYDAQKGKDASKAADV